MMPSTRLERLDLLRRVLDAADAAEDAFGASRRVGMLRQGQNALPDVRGEAQKHERLGHTGSADAPWSGDGCLADRWPQARLPR